MGKCIFFGAPAFSHMKPALGLLRELVYKGETVYAYNSATFKKAIEDTGSIFLLYEDKCVNDVDYENYSIYTKNEYHTVKNIITDYLICFEDYVKYSDMLIDNVSKLNPDYIIFDSVQFFGKRIARMLGIPAICSSSVLAVPHRKYENEELKYLIKNVYLAQVESVQECEQLRKCVLKILEIYKKKYNMYDFDYLDRYGMAGDLNIVYTSKEFQPYSEYLDDTYIFAGCKFSEKIYDIKSENRKKIYISLGSILTRLQDSDAFFFNCLSAFENENVSLVIAAGSKYELLKSYQSDYIRIEKFAEQEKELQQADLVISHGGINTIYESVYYGAPLLIYPYTADQFFNANLIAQYKIGKRIDDISVESIRKNAMQILNDTSFAERSKRLGDTLKIQNGYAMAAEKIIKTTQDKKMRS